VKAVKIFAILLIVYVAIVVAFESLLGYFQPTGNGTLVITTTDDGGNASDRVLSRLVSNDQIYVAVNHWPRAWYHRALDNPIVQVMMDGEKATYVAVPVTGEERDRVESENRHGVVFKMLTGFPPRYFLRLDPQ
jgi:hypothetical protein